MSTTTVVSDIELYQILGDAAQAVHVDRRRDLYRLLAETINTRTPAPAVGAFARAVGAIQQASGWAPAGWDLDTWANEASIDDIEAVLGKAQQAATGLDKPDAGV